MRAREQKERKKEADLAVDSDSASGQRESVDGARVDSEEVATGGTPSSSGSRKIYIARNRTDL